MHAKIALIDDLWCTIGSTKIAARSFHGDAELNASFWCATAVRAMRVQLLAEHLGLGEDTSGLDDRAAMSLYAQTARQNARHYAEATPFAGLAFSLDPATCGRPNVATPTQQRRLWGLVFGATQGIPSPPGPREPGRDFATVLAGDPAANAVRRVLRPPR